MCDDKMDVTGFTVPTYARVSGRIEATGGARRPLYLSIFSSGRILRTMEACTNQAIPALGNEIATDAAQLRNDRGSAPYGNKTGSTVIAS